MSKHTPGSWTAKPREGTPGYLVSPPKGLCVAIVPRGFRSDEECEANARLLAAAPRLRAALATLVDVCHEAPPIVLAEACHALADADGLSQVQMETTGHNMLDRARQTVRTYIAAARTMQSPRVGRPRKPKAE